MPGGVVLGTDDETTPFPGTTIDCFDNLMHLFLVVQAPIDLVIITSSKITHHVLVTIEEHDCALVVKLVHLVKVRHAPRSLGGSRSVIN
jgi:hypothetical protein